MGAEASSHESKYSSNVYEMTIKVSSELETLLENEFGASGRGLHDKITSVEHLLTPALVKRMRFLATVRNKLVHNHTPNEKDLPSRQTFIQAFELSKAELQAIMEKRNPTRMSRHGKSKDCHIL